MKTKRFIALGIVCVMLALTGCGTTTTTNTEKTDTLRVFFQDAITPGVDIVAKAVSEVTLEKLGVNVEFVMFGAGEYSEKIPMLLASKERMDIGYDSQSGYVDRTRRNVYLALDDMLESNGAELKSAIDLALWKGVTIDGKIYGVPTYKEIAEQWVLLIEEGILADNSIDKDSIKSLADAEPILEALKKTPERAGYQVKASNDWHVNLDRVHSFDTITDDFVVLRSEGTDIVNYYMSDEYKAYVELMRDWYNKGYIAKDIATRDDYAEYDDNMRSGLQFISYSPLQEINLSASYGAPITPLFVTPAVITNNSTRGSIFGIYGKSPNPEKAFEFLQMWNTDPQIKNLITFGVEGTHYDLVDGKVSRGKDWTKEYMNQNWASGNVFLSYLTVDEPDNKFDAYKSFNDSAIESVTLGFTPDTSAINDKLVACQGVIKEYSPLLNCGAVDPDEYLPKFIAALKSVGVDEVAAHLQSQFNEWEKSE